MFVEFIGFVEFVGLSALKSHISYLCIDTHNYKGA